MCVFCNLSDREIILESEHAVAFFDSYPVSKGHMLIIPREHYVSYFNIPTHIKKEMWDLVDKAKVLCDTDFQPDGYNVGMNVGPVAGMSIFHAHTHLIPRYAGDVENPRGGVRGVIPDKRDY